LQQYEKGDQIKYVEGDLEYKKVKDLRFL